MNICLGVTNLLVTNNLLSNKRLKIQDNCLLGPLYVLLQTWQNQRISAVIYIFIPTKGINRINLVIHGANHSKNVVHEKGKKKNEIEIFRNSSSIINNFVIFTTKCMLENDPNLF